MTIDEAILHSEEVAEKNKKKAEYSPRMNYYIESRTYCLECASDHRQLAAWLRELKDLREENKVLANECDRLKKEKGELLSKVSGGDVLRIIQLEEQVKDWKEEYANLNKISYGFYEELKEAKRLLKAAVEDFNFVGGALESNNILCMKYIACKGCPFNGKNCNKWRYADEAEKLIGDESDGI